MDAPYAQTRDERLDPARKKASPPPSTPERVKPQASQPKPSQPKSSPTYVAPPQRARIERERVHEPRPTPRPSTPERSAASPAQTQPARMTARPPERDASLARCDELRRRMERAMRDESRTVDERRAIYQEQLRAGCI